MPYARRKKSSRRSVRRYRKKSHRRINNAPFALTKVVKMRYVTQGTLNVGVGGAADGHVFRWNSIYDPDDTIVVGDKQPYSHDEWNNFYDRYEVIGAKATVTFTSRGISSTTISGVAMTTRDNASLDTDGVLIRERPHTRYGWLTSVDARGLKTLSMNWSQRSLSTNDSSTRQAYFGSNPAEVSYLHLYAFPDVLAEDEGTIGYNIQIDYVVKMSDPKELTIS